MADESARDKTLNAMRIVYSKTSMFIKLNIENTFKDAFKGGAIDKDLWEKLFVELKDVYNAKIEKDLP